MKRLGLYLHIPFCVAKCRYCDFYSCHSDAATRAAYVRALAAHLREMAGAAGDYLVDTVYFGGGTPTLLRGEDFALLMGEIRNNYRLSPDAEVTAECNPVTGSEALFASMRAAGVNRISVGLQSIHVGELTALGRLHTPEAFLETVKAARGAGFSNLSVDVMFGIPHQTRESLLGTLTAVCDLHPEHISAYGLRVEEGTPFFLMRDALPLPDEESEEEMAELIGTYLEGRGYRQYEISNFALSGRESRHNMRYWLGEEYLGFGPAAHSFFGGERFSFPSDTAAYIRAAARGEVSSLSVLEERVAGKGAQDEYVMLRMRLADGVERADFCRRFGMEFEEAYGDVSHLVRAGLLVSDGTRVAFTKKGWRVSNAILSDWLDFGGEV